MKKCEFDNSARHRTRTGLKADFTKLGSTFAKGDIAMSVLSRYLPRVDFDSEADFLQNFRLNVPENFNFVRDVVLHYAQHEPERRALVWCDDRGGELILTFADLARRAHQTARAFARLGVGPGDAVLLCLKGRWHFWTCLVALELLGAVGVPATHMLQTGDLVYRFRRLKFKAILAARERGLMNNIRAALVQEGLDLPCLSVDGPENDWPDFNEAAAREADAPLDDPPAARPDDTVLLYFTSGTTGMPKMVPHDRRYPLAHILTARYWHNCQDGGLHYTVADTGWAKCVWGKIYGQWLCGSAVFAYDYDAFDARRMIDRMRHYGVTSFCAPATIYRLMVKDGFDHLDFTALKHCCVAGEPLNPEIFRMWLERTGMELYEGFGQTESILQVATWIYTKPNPGSMGKPAPFYDVALLDSRDQPCDAGGVGEIALRAPEPGAFERPPGLFVGYRDDAEVTASTWHDGYYRTGDLAWRDEDGYYWFVGRSDDLIKSSGYKIGPFEVENALLSHPAVLECAVTGVPDPVRGQAVKATVVLTAGYRDRDEAGREALKKELQTHVKSFTEPYKYPRLVDFVDQLPKTPSGKIRRTALRGEK